MNEVMKQSLLYFLLSAPLLWTACSSDSEPAEAPDTPVELSVSPCVALTKSVINSGTQSGTEATVMQQIAVYAQNTTTNTAAQSNNYAVYAQSGGTWTASGSDKIYLSADPAQIYAYHPAEINDSPLKVNGDASATSTIPISVFEGSTTKDANNTIPTNVNNAGDGASIASAPGETDYMWADQPGKADNGKATNSSGSSKALTMKHALSLVSFRVYNDGTYKNTGSLTKITLSNNSGTILSKGTSPTMNISTGVVTAGNAQVVTYTRFIGASGYTIPSNKDNAYKFSFLVLPENTANKSTVEATFTVDGTDYAVNMPASDAVWVQGNNYIYSIKLSGKGLEISSVSVAAWSNQTVAGDLTIN